MRKQVKEARKTLESVFSVVIEHGKDLIKDNKVYHEFDCYVGISKFDVPKQM